MSNVVNIQSGGKAIIFLLICALTVSITTLGIFIHAYKTFDYKMDLLIADARGNEVIEDSFDSEHYVQQELFDERIALLKEELAQEQEARLYESTLAEQYHPDVTNLPHNKIPYDQVPDDEYAK